MKDGFIKAYCEKSRQYYGLRVEQGKNGTMQVTDFYDIPPAEAKKLGSTVDVPGLTSAENLRPCFRCGTRKVGGCACAQPMYNCQPGQKYRYQCLYCSQLRIFNKDEGAEEVAEGMVGQTIRLTQGQEVVISAAGAGGLEQILIGVGWDVSQGQFNMDLDSSVVVKNSRTNEGELIYFGNLQHESGCVVHHGDNLVGGKGKNTQGDDSENIDIFLRKVPENRDELWFVLNVYDCDRRGQTLGDARNMYIRLSNAKTKQILAEYKVNQGMRGKTAIVIGKAYRTGGNWKFKALGQSMRVSAVGEIAAYCHD